MLSISSGFCMSELGDISNRELGLSHLHISHCCIGYTTLDPLAKCEMETTVAIVLM